MQGNCAAAALLWYPGRQFGVTRILEWIKRNGDGVAGRQAFAHWNTAIIERRSITKLLRLKVPVDLYLLNGCSGNCRTGGQLEIRRVGPFIDKVQHLRA